MYYAVEEWFLFQDCFGYSCAIVIERGYIATIYISYNKTKINYIINI